MAQVNLTEFHTVMMILANSLAILKPAVTMPIKTC